MGFSVDQLAKRTFTLRFWDTNSKSFCTFLLLSYDEFMLQRDVYRLPSPAAGLNDRNVLRSEDLVFLFIFRDAMSFTIADLGYS